MKNGNESNKTAIITGASGNGIGRSIALTLAKAQFNLVINYKSNRQVVEEHVLYITMHGSSVVAVRADVFVKDECWTLVERCMEIYDRIDICIICPDASWNCEERLELDSAKSIVDVQQELLQIYNLLLLVIPDMSKRSWGRILAVSSNMHWLSPAYSYNTAKCCRTDAILNASDYLCRYRILPI